jgi:hypothetical protein
MNKDDLIQDAYNAIIEDSDRLEAIIEEISDLIQDILFSNGAYDAQLSNNCIIGIEISELIRLKIEACAEDDVDQLLQRGET